MYKIPEGTIGISSSFFQTFTETLSTVPNSEKRDWDLLCDNEGLPPSKRARVDRVSEPSSNQSHTPSQVTSAPPLGPGGAKLLGLMKENSGQITAGYSGKLGFSNGGANFLRRLKLPWEAGERQSSARHEVSVMQKAELAFKNKGRFTPGLYNDLVNLSDDTFELVLSRNQDMDIEILNMITTYVWAKNAEGELVTENKRKFIAIARYGLLPKLSAGPSNYRTLYQSYEKLVAVDQELVMDHILIPLLKSIGSFPKVLYSGITTSKFLVKILDLFANSYSLLNDPNFISTLTFLVEKQQEFLPPSASKTLYKFLELSLQLRPSDQKIGSLFHLIVKKFINSMTPDELHQVATLNHYNQTIWQPYIDVLLAERLKSQEPQVAPIMNNNNHSTIRDSHCHMSHLSEQMKHMSASEEMDMD